MKANPLDLMSFNLIPPPGKVSLLSSVKNYVISFRILQSLRFTLSSYNEMWEMQWEARVLCLLIWKSPLQSLFLKNALEYFNSQQNYMDYLILPLPTHLLTEADPRSIMI